MRKTYRNGLHQVLICSLLTTLLKLTNMGRPSGWPWQLGTIIWAALAVLGQRACACGPREILTPNYSVCFILPLVLSPPLVIPPPPKRQRTARIHMHSLYGKLRPHMVHIMWFEWSYRWQTHPERLKTCSCSSKSENMPTTHIEEFQPRTFYHSNKNLLFFKMLKCPNLCRATPDFLKHHMIQPRIFVLKELSYLLFTHVTSCGVDSGISC